MILPSVSAINRISGDEVVLDIGVASDHPAFDGHFPGQPILPGVVQIDWAVRLAADYLATGCRVATDFQVKFRRVIRPGDGINLKLKVDREKQTLSFEYAVVGEIASIGRIRLERPE